MDIKPLTANISTSSAAKLLLPGQGLSLNYDIIDRFKESEFFQLLHPNVLYRVEVVHDMKSGDALLTVSIQWKDPKLNILPGGALYRYDGANSRFLKGANSEPQSNPEKYYMLARILDSVDSASPSDQQAAFESIKAFQASYRKDSEFFNQLTSIERVRDMQREVGKYISLYSGLVSRTDKRSN